MRTHKLTINEEERFASIECFEDGELYITYRTSELSDDEMDGMDDWTENDIRDYLRTSGDYYEFKKRYTLLASDYYAEQYLFNGDEERYYATKEEAEEAFEKECKLWEEKYGYAEYDDKNDCIFIRLIDNVTGNGIASGEFDTINNE